MVQRRTCSFCGEEIEPGTGKMFIKRDGTVFFFCTSKCQKNLLHLGRVPRRVPWTRHYMKVKAPEMAKLAGGEPLKAKKVRKEEIGKEPQLEEKEEE